MGTKEQVKKGLLSAGDAMSSLSKGSHTYGWCQRRLMRKSESKKAEEEPAPKQRKYRHKPVKRI